MKELKKILIANRGEITLRAIRTIKEMNKKSISVYSTADKDNHYLHLSDSAICVGGNKSSESYLNVPAIMSAIDISGADAVFPGYGFLSENAKFVDICDEHNISFIGPSSYVMNLMSDKSQAKDVMRKAGMPVIEGSEGVLKNVDEAKSIAKVIGYPVVLKATAGGGGKGMRIVDKEQDIENMYFACENEAIASFGNGTMYIEKFINKPRHIEVQILADKHGNVVHLGERDCSMQRRNQKLIEETPAIILHEKTRNKLLKVAIDAAKYIKYESAGTFEFLVDESNNFYFMEMNTRLQVEHTVSECVSNIDIIEWMIKIEEGATLFKQSDVVLKGHAIECRILAEHSQTFIPSAGKITKLVVPGGRNVRFDSHIYGGYVVPPYYDSMIGKIISWGEDREEAINIMKRILDEFVIEGINTTIDFHKKMLENTDFIHNEYDTKYIDTKL